MFFLSQETISQNSSCSCGEDLIQHKQSKKVKSLAYYPTLQICLKKFNSEFGNVVVRRIKAADLENLEAKRRAAGLAESTIDQEIGPTRTMINKAFDDDPVGGGTLKTFKKIKKLLKRNTNVRDKILHLGQFNQLLKHLLCHTRKILATPFYIRTLIQYQRGPSKGGLIHESPDPLPVL